MASSFPATVTATMVASQGIWKAGYSTPASAQVTRGINHFLQEIKADIWSIAKEMKALQYESVYSLSEGLSRYDFPTSVSKLISATLLDGTHYGTCQAGGSTSKALFAATESIDADWIVGKEIMVYVTATPLIGYMSQCSSYSDTTKTVNVAPAWAASPDTDYSYLVVDKYYPLGIKPIWDWDAENYPTKQQRPVSLHPMGDETEGGEFLLFPSPEDGYYGLKLRYYLNLMTLNETGTLYGNLLRRWRNVWIQGVKAKQLEYDDDNRAQIELQKYALMLQTFILREKYGMQLSNLSMSVSD